LERMSRISNDFSKNHLILTRKEIKKGRSLRSRSRDALGVFPPAVIHCPYYCCVEKCKCKRPPEDTADCGRD